MGKRLLEMLARGHESALPEQCHTQHVVSLDQEHRIAIARREAEQKVAELVRLLKFYVCEGGDRERTQDGWTGR